MVNSDGLNSTTIVKDKNMVLLKAAEYLRNDILEHIASCDTSNWPPTVENLSEFDENFPKSLSMFLTKILKAKDNPLSGSMQRYVHSFGSDLVNAMANGKIVTLKHFLLGLGLYNITGLRMPIKVLSHLGHCIDYILVCEIETAEAEIALQWLAEHEISSLQQDHEDSDVQHIVFWWLDNFNQKLDSASGYGTIDATHIVEFTEFSTIKKVFEILIDRAKRANIPYINVILDVGGALKAYKVLWNCQDEFNSIFIHLGDFHFIKECVNFLRCLISGSGFEAVVHQAELCSPGSLNGVISSSHYNRCWTVHANFAEALERLLFQRFLKTYSEIESAVDDDLQNIDQSKLENIEINSKTEKIPDAYSKFKQVIRDGKYGKTSQFWVVMYLDVIRNVYLLHRAVQENNFSFAFLGGNS